MDEEVESQQNLSSDWPGPGCERVRLRSREKELPEGQRERGLPFVPSTQVFDLLEQMLLHIEEFPQIEDLTKHFLPWKTLQLTKEHKW